MEAFCSFHSAVPVPAGRRASTRRSKRKSDVSLHEVAQLWLPEMKERTRANHLTALRSIRTFCNGHDPLLHEFTTTLIGRYEQWLLQRGVLPNTVACYLRSLRGLYQRAVRSGRTVDSRPFVQCHTGNRVTPKRALTPADLHRIASVQLPDDSRLHLVRDVFLFSLFAMGMPFVDLVHLRRCNVFGNYIVYRRRKTGVEVTVRIERHMQRILDRWHRDGSDRLFPQLSEGLDLNDERDYRHALEHYNRRLRHIGRLAGLTVSLTSYRARHSWASVAYNEGIDIGTISSGLGHTNPRTTRIYISGGRNKKLEKANRTVLKTLSAHLCGIGVHSGGNRCKVTNYQ